MDIVPSNLGIENESVPTNVDDGVCRVEEQSPQEERNAFIASHIKDDEVHKHIVILDSNQDVLSDPFRCSY